MTRGQGTSELRREKKRSHQWRGVAKILAAPPGTGRSATGLFSAHQRGTAKPCVRGQGGDLAETNYLLAHISEDKGHKRNKGIGVFHEYAFLVCSCKKTFFLSIGAALSEPPPPPFRLDEIRPPSRSRSNFSARKVLISSSLPRSSGTRVVSSHILAGICSRTLDSYPACHHFKLF